MSVWQECLPWFALMTALIGLSGFFSASEAALFSLRHGDRRAMQRGNAAQRLAAELLDAPERLLSAVLFWNLVVNLAYFAIVSIVGFKIDASEALTGASWIFAGGSLLAIIFFSEMAPKTLGVLGAQRLAPVLSRPLSLAIVAVDPIMPSLQFVNRVSGRLIWPSLQTEPSMELQDLEQAIAVSREDRALADQERVVLNNIVSLSDIRVDEWMRPRTQFTSFRPPVSLTDLNGRLTPSGYLLVTEGVTEEIVAALHLPRLSALPEHHLERLAEPVIPLPWCSTVAEAFERLSDEGVEVAAIVNEYGDTIGILTREDILDTVFNYSPSRSKILLNEKPIHDIAPNVWIVAGVTSLRRLSKYLNRVLPPSKSVTVGGVIQERLQKLAEEGDQCMWGDFRLQVLEAPQRGHMLIRITLTVPEADG